MERNGGNGFLSFLLIVCVGIGMILSVVGLSGAYAFEAKMKNIGEVGVNQPVEIDFNQPVLLINADNIKISPEISFSYKLSDNREVLTIIPDSSLKFENKYIVTLEGVRGISGSGIEERKFVFYTPEKKATAEAVLASMNLNDRKDEQFGEVTLSKDKEVQPPASTPSTAKPAAKKSSYPQPHILKGKYIDVSISRQIMTLFEDGKVTNQFLVSTGKAGMPTPLGTFTIKTKENNHWSTKYKLWMPYSMNISGPYYIHELPYWPDGYKETSAHLGRKVSHGCIRLGRGPAKYVFDWASIGTPVYVHQQ